VLQKPLKRKECITREDIARSRASLKSLTTSTLMVHITSLSCLLCDLYYIVAVSKGMQVIQLCCSKNPVIN